jgi:glutathione peroxidase
MSTASLYDIPVNKITGEGASLADYRGKVLLLVNVASQCGLTPQYDALVKIYARFKDS